MNSEHIKNIMRAWQEVVEKKTMDPVNKKALKKDFDDRMDKDIDNDGDADKSDEYLHKRRQAISKSMKNESEDEMKPCSKCDGSMQNHNPDCPMADNDDDDMDEASCNRKMKKESVDIHEQEIPTGIKIHHSDPTGKKRSMIVFTARDAQRAHKELKKDGHTIHGHSLMYGKKEGPMQKMKEGAEMFDEAKDLDKTNADKAIVHDCATHVASEQYGFGECIPGQHTIAESGDGIGYVTHYDVMFEHGIEFNVPVNELKVLASSMHGHKRKKKAESKNEATDYAKHTKGATKPEMMKDKLKGKGAQDMAKDADMDNPELAADDSKGHEDATKAGRVVSKQAPTRGQEKRMGDMSIVNPVKGAVTKTTGKEG